MEDTVSSWASWAKKVAYDALEPGESPGGAANGADLERGSGEDAAAQWSSWATSAFGRARQQAAEAATAVSQVAERAASADWADQAKGWQSEVGNVFGRVADGATQAGSLAGSVLSEKGKVASQLAKDFHGMSQTRLMEAQAIGATKAREAREKAAAAAGAAAKGLERAGSGITGSLGGLAALTMSPVKLAQFAGTFFAGILLITMSFSFLPMLVIAPQKFALLFAFGSMTMLGSFAILKTPKVFIAGLFRREQLPFSVCYIIGLVGTLFATLVMRSFVYTAVFGVIQAVALLYFMASYVPGGKSVLNFIGRLCSRAARALACGRAK
mmetsp:Transcript_13783/g.27862  ORF Transcript_13783/g.27862 Transcript_13783/m.27862 type:complete len:327 (+) Transcript_13783:116-1096(+)